MRKHEIAINQFLKLRILNYINEENIDFYLEVELSGDRTAELLLQPVIKDGYIVDITSADAKDDSWIINSDFVEEIKDAMNNLIDENNEEEN